MDEIKNLIEDYKAEALFAKQQQKEHEGDNYLVDAYLIIQCQYEELVGKLSSLKPNSNV